MLSPVAEQGESEHMFSPSPQRPVREIVSESIGDGPRAHPSPSNSKWWHVPDTQIEQLVQSLDASRNVKTLEPALRKSGKSATSPKQRTVKIEAAGGEDSLDVAMRESARDGGFGTALSSTNKKTGWRVSDEKVNDFIQHTAHAMAARGEDLGLRSKLRATGGRLVLASHTAECPEGCTCHYVGAGSISHSGKPCAMANHLGSGAAQYARSPMQSSASTRKMSGSEAPGKSHRVRTLKHDKRCLGNSKIDPEIRPRWISQSNPNLFAHVGVGLDGQGNKTVKPDRVAFESKSIYLPDMMDERLSRVRCTVSGHCAYMS